MRVFENQQLTIDYDEDRSYFKVKRESSDDISEEKYRKLMLQWRREVEIYKPKYQLINYLNYYKPIPPSMQIWINENLIRPSREAGMKRVAFIISQDFEVQVSVENTMLEIEGKRLNISYFDNEVDAEKWLFS